jgi:ubiquinone/menaquinone biosynthesis C-methylase UbiE
MPVTAAKNEARFVEQILKITKSRVLDLACGYGRHSRHLAGRNTVVGLDLSHLYLTQAKSGMPVLAAQKFHPVCADMRQLPFAGSSFDAVLLLFNSFGYFGAHTPAAVRSMEAPKQQVWKLPQVFYERQLVPDTFGKFGNGPGAEHLMQSDTETALDGNSEVLKEIVRVLSPNGQGLIELPNRKPLLAAIQKAPRRHVIASGYEIEEQYEWNPQRSVLSNRTRFRYKGQLDEGEYHLRLYTLKEARAMLHGVGLQLVASFGSYEGESYQAASSPMLLMQLRKK